MDVGNIAKNKTPKGSIYYRVVSIEPSSNFIITGLPRPVALEDQGPAQDLVQAPRQVAQQDLALHRR